MENGGAQFTEEDFAEFAALRTAAATGTLELRDITPAEDELHRSIGLMENLEVQAVEIDYTNWRGIRALRVIRPVPGTLQFKYTEYHPTAQWMFDAMDLDKTELRTFALADIHSWRPIEVKNVPPR